jgi:hypothetical protein
MLSIVMQNVILMNVFMLSIIMIMVIVINFVERDVDMLRVAMPSVVTPLF